MDTLEGGRVDTARFAFLSATQAKCGIWEDVRLEQGDRQEANGKMTDFLLNFPNELMPNLL